jgi:predicted ArsR family transcriptional regulator
MKQHKQTYDRSIRKRVLRLLRDGKPYYVSRVAKEARTTQITARKHLKRLCREGLAEEIKNERVCLFRRKIKNG